MLDNINEAFDTARRKEDSGAVFVAITISREVVLRRCGVPRDPLKW
jgi:hypothetical protein